MASITFRHVYKRYGNNTVVKDLNIDVEDKEFLVFVGPSGCGKSTSLRMLAGLEEISDGEIWIGDRVVNNVAPKDRDVAMVFQSYALYPHMTVYDNMAFGLKLRKTPKHIIDERVKSAADSGGPAVPPVANSVIFVGGHDGGAMPPGLTVTPTAAGTVWDDEIGRAHV